MAANQETIVSATVVPPRNETTESLVEQLMERLAAGTLANVPVLDPEHCETLYSLGHSLYMQRRFPDAARIFGHLAAQDCTDRRYLLACAGALQMAGAYGEAVSMYTMATLMDMTDPTPCFRTCECLMALDLKAEAAEGLEIVVRQCNGDPAYAELGARAQAMLDLVRQAGHKEKTA